MQAMVAFFHPVYLCFFTFTLTTGNVPEEQLFPFGPAVGDAKVPATNDAFVGPIKLKVPFQFFDNTHDKLYVNSLGLVSFFGGFHYVPDCEVLSERYRMIAPLWADLHSDTGFGGATYYRESNSQELITKTTLEISTAFPNLWDASINYLYIVTWYQMPFYGSNNCGYTNMTVPRNTFQLILATDSIYSFAIFYYTNITWTTAMGASGGNCSGLGGKAARAAFDVGDGKTFYTIPGSCTNDILHVAETSNINSPGKWVFRLDSGHASPVCDTESYMTQPLKISPSFSSLFGQIPVTISGPCFNNSYTAKCLFHDTNRTTEVPAVIIMKGHVPTASCIVPYLYWEGRHQVDLILKFEEEEERYSGFIFANGLDPTFELNVTFLEDDQVFLNFTWDKTTFPSNATLELALLEFGEKEWQWIEKGVFGLDIPNTGKGQLTMPSQNISTFATFSLRLSNYHRREKRIWNILLPALGSVIVYAGGGVDGKRCNDWYKDDPGVPHDTLHCPPLVSQALADNSFQKINAISFTQRVASPSGATQTCYYDSKTGQIINGHGGGPSYRWDPQSHFFRHTVFDTKPYVDCCKLSLNPGDCDKWHEKRPSDPGNEYKPCPRSKNSQSDGKHLRSRLYPGATTKDPTPTDHCDGKCTGDPHFTTFDGTFYTFNGIGEFWLIKHQDPSQFQMQGRTEQWQGIPAAAFTSFVMKQESDTIQVQISAARTIDILFNGYVIDFGPEFEGQQITTDTATISMAKSRTSVTIAFSIGYTFTFAVQLPEISIIYKGHLRNRGKTKGLFGAFDGNKYNDFETPEGTIIPWDSSVETLHYNFGLKWRILKNESIFVYGKNKTYDSYQDPTFKPRFDYPDPRSLPPDVNQMCGEDLSCRYDYAASGSRDMANQTVTTNQKYDDTVKVLSQDVPMCNPISAPANGYVDVVNFLVGANATFGCYDGYKLVGKQSIICNEDKKWSGVIPKCVAEFTSTVVVVTTSVPPISTGAVTSTGVITTTAGQISTGGVTTSAPTSTFVITTSALLPEVTTTRRKGSAMAIRGCAAMSILFPAIVATFYYLVKPWDY